MRKNTIKKTLLSSFLLLGSLFCISMSFLNKNIDTVSASYTSGDVLYLDVNNYWGDAEAKYRIHVRWQDSSSGGLWSNYGELLYDKFYKITLPTYESVNYLYIVRENPNDSSKVWNSISVQGEISKNKIIEVTGWNNSYKTHDSASVSVQQIVDGANKETIQFPISSGQNTNVSRFTSQLKNYFGKTKGNYYDSISGGNQVTTVNGTKTIYNRYTSAELYTVYFDAGSLSSTYSTPYWYAYDTNGKSNADWPGQLMTKVSDSKKSIYDGFVWSATIPSNCKVVFNPGSESGKTADLTPQNNKTYLINTLGVGDWYEPITLTTINQDTATTTEYFIYKNGDTGINFTMPSLSKEHYVAKWNTEQDGSGDDYTPGATNQKFTANQTLYSKFTLASYNITYSRVLNGVDTEKYPGTDTQWWGTTTKSVEYGTYLNAVEPKNIYGYSFDGWFSDVACTIGIGSSQITEDTQKVYAKFSSTLESKMIYVAIKSGTNAYSHVTTNGELYMWVTNGTNTTKDIPMQKVNGITSTNLYMIAVPNDATSFTFHSRLSSGEMQTGYKTIDLTLNSSGTNNMFVCYDDASESTGWNYSGEWKKCYFQFQISSSNSDWSSATKIDMSEPASLSTKNDAEATNVATKANNYFRVAVVIDGTENYITTPGNDSNTLAVISSSGQNQFKNTTTKVNVYLKNNTIYLLDSTNITNGGYLYILTDNDVGSISLSVSFTVGSETKSSFSATKLSNVSDVKKTTTLTIDNINGVIRVPIYNLRGTLTPNSDSNYNVILNGKNIVLPQITTGGAFIIYLTKIETPEKDTADALAVKAAFNIDDAIKATKNSSVCECSKETCTILKNEYEAASSSTLLSDAFIYTYESTLSVGTKKDMELPLVYTVIESKAQSALLSGLYKGRYVSLDFTGEEGGSGIVLVIVLSSVALLSLAGISFLVYKKKKHN